MSKEQPQHQAQDQVAESRPAAAHGTLDALLAEREALCAQLSARQVEFAALVKDQAGEIAGLRAALAEARASVTERYEETARLSKLLLKLEEAGARGAEESVRLAAELKRHDERHAVECTSLKERLDALQRDHAMVLERERALAAAAVSRDDALRRHEHARALAEHALAARNIELGSAREAIAGLREVASALRATLVQVTSTRAWKMGRLVFRQAEVDIPPGEPDVFDAIAYQTRLLRDSDLFDPDWYMATYPDVADSGMDPAEHYLRAGTLAGYNPGPAFDTVAYLLRYGDVRKSGMNPLVHFLEHGRAELRDPGPAADAFDAATSGNPVPAA